MRRRAGVRTFVGLLSVGIACGGLLLCGRPAAAQTFNWEAAVAAGDFEEAANWTEAGAPTNAADIAQFNTAAQHAVDFNGSWTNARLEVGGSGDAGTDVTFDLGGNTYTLSSASAVGTATALRVGDAATASLMVTGVGTLDSGGFVLGRLAGGDGRLYIEGGETIWNSGTAAAVVGYNMSTGVLHVTQGAQATVGPVTMDVGSLDNAYGAMLIAGSNTVLRNEHNVRLANRATATADVRVEDHAVWHVANDLYSDSGTDTLTIDNATVYVGRFRMSNSGAQSSWQVINGGVLAITNATDTSWIGLASERAQAELLIASGGRFLVDNPDNRALFIGTIEDGRLVVTGDGSRLDYNQGGIVHVGRGWTGAENHGALIVESNAVAVISNFLYIAAGGDQPNATVSVTSGGTLTVASARTRVGGTTSPIALADGMLEILDGGKVDSPQSDFVLYGSARSELRISDGTMRQASVTFQADTLFNVTLHTGNHDARITSLGNASINNSLLELSLAPGFSAATYGEEFILIDYAGTLTGTFTDKPDDHEWTVDGYTFRINYDTTEKLVLLTTIPEANSLALLVFFGGGLWLWRRRR